MPCTVPCGLQAVVMVGDVVPQVCAHHDPAKDCSWAWPVLAVCRANNCLKSALELNCVKALVKKVKGICAFFHRSCKVMSAH